MKRIHQIIAAAAALLLASCTEVSMTGPQDELSLEPSAGATTKAPIAGTAFPASRQLRLTAYFNSPSATYRGTYFQDIPFNRFADGKWKGGTTATPNPKYWPQNGTLDFLAYSVLPSLEAASTVTYGANVAAGLTFAMGDNRTIQDDILFAGRDKLLTPAAAVDLTFKHAETQVAFRGRSTVAYNVSATANAGVTVTGVSVRQAYWSGTCAVTRSTNDVSFAWSDLGSQANRSVTGLSAAAPKHLTATLADLGTAGTVLPPQDAVQIYIYYTIHNGFKADGTTPLDYDTYYVYTPSGTWDAGKKYVYDITFTMNEIQVSPTVTDWAEQTHTAAGF